MDPLANLLSVLEEGVENEENQEPKKKGKKKKKMTSAMSKKTQARLAEEAKQLLIRQKQEFLRETKSRVQSEWEKNLEKANVYEAQFETRLKQLKFSFQRLSQVETSWKEYVKEREKNQEWLQYLKCGLVPNPTSVPDVNSYIYEWRELDRDHQMSHCLKKTEEVIELLSDLEDYIKDPGESRPPNFVTELKDLRRKLRESLHNALDEATFILCSRIETDMESINVTTSKHYATCRFFNMSLWAELITPIPSSRLKEVRQPMKVLLEDTNLEITVPVSLLDVHKVLRTMWLKSDHFTDLSRSYHCPPVPSYFHKTSLNHFNPTWTQTLIINSYEALFRSSASTIHRHPDLLELFLSQSDVKQEIMNERAKHESTMRKRIGAIPADPSLSQELLVWDSEPQRALSEEIAYREWKEEDDLGRQVTEWLDEHEVNIRERTILGDLLVVQILHQPSQPKHLRYKHSVTLRKEPPTLNVVDFHVKYPPSRGGHSREGTDEEKETSVRTRLALKHEEEEEIKKLISLQMKPCSTVVWFEQPLLARWDKINGYWSTEDVHCTAYDEENDIITCKIGKLGLIGMHVSRYCNFPFEDWLFEPDDKGKIHFYLKTPKAEFHFKIRETEVCLENMLGVPSKAMNWILGIYYPPDKLREALKKGGVDIFPDPDAGSYIDGILTKHVVVENNIYQVWALFSQDFRFRHSKFCQLAERQNIIFQAQEIYKNHQVDYCLINTSMGSCYVLDIREDSETYSSHPAPYMESFADLYNLLIKNCTMKAKRRSDVTSYLLVQTVKDFVGSIRPLSFCLR